MFIPSDWYGADEFFEIQGTSGFIWVTRLSGRLHDLPPLVVGSGRTRTAITDMLLPITALKALQLAFAVYKSSNDRVRVDPNEIDDAVSPPWSPKTPEKLIDDVVALGLMPEGMEVSGANQDRS